MIKAVIVIMLVAMIVSLGVGLYHLLKTPDQGGKDDKVVKALTWRIAISATLFGFIILAIQMGWIKPSNSVNPINFSQEQLERIEAKKEH